MAAARQRPENLEARMPASKPFDSIGLRGAREEAARSLRSVTDVRISHDGTRMVTIASRRKPPKLVWSKALEEAGKCKPLPKRKKPKKKVE